jgi:hypothetical protein
MQPVISNGQQLLFYFYAAPEGYAKKRTDWLHDAECLAREALRLEAVENFMWWLRRSSDGFSAGCVYLN